jgi:acetoin utilization deacetylase AcuC-like enzyme
VITFFSPLQALHAPEHEFFRGERVPCHESPQRAAFVLDALREPDHDAAVVLPRVHAPRYLAFLKSAWEQWLALDADAGADFMGGYCFLNNAAIAAQALRDGGCQRVAVLDVDYHHGNGTQSLFYERDDVLVVSLQGAKHSNAQRHCEHSQRRSAPVSRGQHRSDFSDSVD